MRFTVCLCCCFDERESRALEQHGFQPGNGVYNPHPEGGFIEGVPDTARAHKLKHHKFSYLPPATESARDIFAVQGHAHCAGNAIQVNAFGSTIRKLTYDQRTVYNNNAASEDEGEREKADISRFKNVISTINKTLNDEEMKTRAKFAPEIRAMFHEMAGALWSASNIHYRGDVEMLQKEGRDPAVLVFYSKSYKRDAEDVITEPTAIPLYIYSATQKAFVPAKGRTLSRFTAGEAVGEFNLTKPLALNDYYVFVHSQLKAMRAKALSASTSVSAAATEIGTARVSTPRAPSLPANSPHAAFAQSDEPNLI